MKKTRFLSIAVHIVVVLVIFTVFCQTDVGVPSTQAQQQKSATSIIDLPPPVIDGSLSLEKALSQRRSVRSYSDQPLTLADISQILWAAQGITEPKRGLRTAPSPRASYLLKVYILAERVTNLSIGMYQYQPQGHKLVKIADGDIKENLYRAAPQSPIKNAPAAIVIAGLSNKAEEVKKALNLPDNEQPVYIMPIGKK